MLKLLSEHRTTTLVIESWWRDSHLLFLHTCSLPFSRRCVTCGGRLLSNNKAISAIITASIHHQTIKVSPLWLRNDNFHYQKTGKHYAENKCSHLRNITLNYVVYYHTKLI